MQWLKKNFLQLSIHRQLHFGIISVSSFVCFLVLVLITINIFMLLNLSYNDLVIILENKENQQIEAISINVAISVNIVAETSKNGVQYIRNLMENLKRNSDFFRIFDNIDISAVVKPYDPKGYSDCNSSNGKFRNCIVYMNFTDTDNQSFKQYSKIVGLTFPMVNISLDYRFYDYKEQPIYNNIVFLSNNFQTSFTFPFNNANPNFTKSDLRQLIQGHVLTTIFYQQYFNNMLKTNSMINIKIPKRSFVESLELSPIISSFSIIDPINEPFIKKNDFYLNTYSSKFLITNPQDATINNSPMIDIVSADWDSNIIDNYSFYTDGYYRGVKSIISPYTEGLIEMYLVTNAPCLYFIKFYNLYNNITELTLKLPFKNLTSCILFEKGKSYVNQFFYESNGTVYNPLYVKRKTNIPLINGYMDSSEEKAINFKVFQYIMPDPFQQGLLKSNYFTLNKFKHFLIKNTRFLEIYKNYVFYKIAGSFCKIIFYNNILWILILILISFVLFQVTRNITGPINKISEIVTSLGRESNHEEGISKLSDENFTYSDDKDINELFLICKKIIKGGFSDDHINTNMNNNENLYYIGSSHNHISYVKTNNLIIDEAKIEEATNASALAILNYVKKDEIIKETINENPDRLETEKLKKQQTKSFGGNRVLYTEDHIMKCCEYIVSMMDKSKKNYLFKYYEGINIQILNANV
jgi:hypothetical protein